MCQDSVGPVITTTTTAVAVAEGAPEVAATYWNLIRHNRPFRLYFWGYLITYGGEWFTFVASVALIERINLQNAENQDYYDGDQEHAMEMSSTSSSSLGSQTTISILIFVRLLPFLLLSAPGGVLADSMDRRHSMIILDIIGSIIPFLYAVALYVPSIWIVYAVAFLQASVMALYLPCHSAILSLLVPQDDFLKLATILDSIGWGMISALGAGLGGLAVSLFGIQTCLVIDSVSYLISGIFMWMMGGSWDASVETLSTTENTDTKMGCFGPCHFCLRKFKNMIIDSSNYLSSVPWGALVLLKSSIALVVGASDVLFVSFSEMDYGDGPLSREEKEGRNSERLGMLLAVMALGCVLGSVVSDKLTDVKQPKTVLALCVWSFSCAALGYAGMGSTRSFAVICFFNLFRASGISVIWALSSILLQLLSKPDMLGRVFAVDYALGTMCQAGSALLAGILQDDAELSPAEVCWVMAFLGGFMFLLWYVYLVPMGAGNAIFPTPGKFGTKSEESESLVPKCSLESC